MCPTHHRAYDQNVLLVAESYRLVAPRRLAGLVGQPLA